eukprot:COSAG02_NODE_290_length_25531_cov_75.132392_11_plen_128_part_00
MQSNSEFRNQPANRGSAGTIRCIMGSCPSSETITRPGCGGWPEAHEPRTSNDTTAPLASSTLPAAGHGGLAGWLHAGSQAPGANEGAGGRALCRKGVWHGGTHGKWRAAGQGQRGLRGSSTLRELWR